MTERVSGGTGRYLHVLRDPRDMAASWLRRAPLAGTRRESTLLRLCIAWSRSVRWSRHNREACRGRYVVLRYEDLAHQTADAMQRVCRFLGLPADGRVLTPTAVGRPILPNSSFPDVPEIGGAVLATQMGRHREVLQDREVLAIEWLLGEQMRALGYAPDEARDAPQDVSAKAFSRAVRTNPRHALRVLELRRAGRVLGAGDLVVPIRDA